MPEVKVTIRWRSGLVEDVPISVAYRLLESGDATSITPLPPVETAMLEDPKPRRRRQR